jgi:Flp pilus assembly protein TadG
MCFERAAAAEHRHRTVRSAEAGAVTLGRRLFRDDRASAAAELALILPAVAFILLNVVDFSVYLYTRMQVDLAAQEAVGIARTVSYENECEAPVLSDVKCASLEDDMAAAAQSTSLGNSVSIDGTLEDRYCATSGGELVTVDDSDADCSGTLAGSTAVPGYYISTTAAFDFSPVFPGASVASVLPPTITRTAFMRIQ